MTDQDIKVAAHVACCSLVYRTYEQLALPLQNLALELQSEKGPFKKGARSHAQTCTGIIKSVKELHNAKLKFRRFLGSSSEADDLLRKLAILLAKLSDDVFKPLRKASKSYSESFAHKTILSAAVAADQLSLAANRNATKAQNLLAGALKLLAKVKVNLLPVPVPIAPKPKGGKLPPHPATQTLPVLQRKMSVVSIDMSEYGRLSAMLEEVASVQTLFQFNQDLQSFFRKKVEAVHCDPNQVPSINTGDGALMFFPKGAQAVRFALAVQEDAITNNRRMRDPNNKKRYRIGLCTGEICLQETRTPNGVLVNFSVAGAAIARAVRLQAKCEPDQLLLCEDTYVDLSKNLRAKCGQIQSIEGKVHETWKISARHCVP